MLRFFMLFFATTAMARPTIFNTPDLFSQQHRSFNKNISGKMLNHNQHFVERHAINVDTMSSHQQPFNHQRSTDHNIVQHAERTHHVHQGTDHQVEMRHNDHQENVEKVARHSVEHSVSTEKTAASARILQQDMEVNPDGSHFNVWSSDNGISVQEQGTVKQVGETYVPVRQGEISYIDNDGHQYYVKYVADENGFHAEGEHLPTSPPIPPGIARGLEYIAAHPHMETTTAHPEHYDHEPNYQAPIVVDN